jgi:hypothetical protein
MKLVWGLNIILVILTAVCFWLMMPVLSFGFTGGLMWLILASGLGVFISFLGDMMPSGKGGSKEQSQSPVGKGLRFIWLSVFVLTAVYLGVAFVGSSSFFTWQTKQAELKIVEVKAFDTSVPNVDMQNLVILDEEDARRTSEKLITEKDATMGSLYQIGEGTLSVVGQKPYWIFPMEHRGFFKWLTTKGKIPGYLKVSATNFNDAVFVDSAFTVSPSSFWMEDLKRSVYMQYPQYGLTDLSFEIDEAGKPYWVVTAYKHATWISTPHVEGTIIVDPTTNTMTFHAVGQQPEWVDRVYGMAFFDKQLDWYGTYMGGWWNPSDTGKLQDTEGMGYVFKEGQLYFYTGLTSVGKDSATTGFVIFNPRSGEAQYHRISGSVEMKAVGLMEELVQNSGYTASFPYLINLNGEATYFSTLKGNSGNVVGYAFASVKNYKAVAWAETLREAQTAYNRALLREGSSNSLSGQEQDVVTIKGTVGRIGLLSDGYYILQIGGAKQFYVVNSEQFPMVALTAFGDFVTLTHLKSEATDKIDVMTFQNSTVME